MATRLERFKFALKLLHALATEGAIVLFYRNVEGFRFLLASVDVPEAAAANYVGLGEVVRVAGEVSEGVGVADTTGSDGASVRSLGV